MQVVEVSIEKLVHDPNNARSHGEKNLEAIKGSLAKFGQQKPIVVNRKNIVIAGNGTLEAAKALGWEKVKVVVTDLDDFSQTAFAIADNRTAELAAWDDEILSGTLKSLEAANFDLSMIGFDKTYLDSFNTLMNPEPVEGAKELSEGDFQEFEHTCPRCGFAFDGGKDASPA